MNMFSAKVTRLVLAFLLFAAALLKAYELATNPVNSVSILHSHVVKTLTIQWELFLSIWLFCGWRRRLLWGITFTSFTLFFIVSLLLTWRGAETCGCFGAVNIDPGFMLALDTFVLFTLGATRTGWERVSSSNAISVKSAIGIYAIASMMVMAWILSHAPSSLSAEGVLVGDNDLVLLEPHKWIGNSLPLLEFIDSSALLSEGDWELMLHRHDCSICEEVVPSFVRNSGSKRGLVEIPPFGPQPSYVAVNGSVLDLRLRPDYDWFVTTPVVLTLANGKVTAVKTDFP